MNRIQTVTLSLLLAAFAATVTLARAASSTGDLLQQGLYAEEVEGDLAGAIKTYGLVIKNNSAPPNHVAQALYRQGMCYLKLKDEAAAKGALEKLVADYSAQTEIVEKARPVLEDLTNFDPASLMPPGTLVYLELGNPGRQVETILNLLRGTPFENPLAVIGGNSGEKSPGDILGALLNPSMITEFKKIRSSAIGITEIAENNPPMVAVLYPGKSDALRGLILAGLGMVGKPANSIEGMQTLKLPEDAMVAYDDRVILAARPARQLEWCVKRYKGLNSEPSLATSNKSFAKVSKTQRQKNLLTLWANVDEAYGQLLSRFPGGRIPQRVLAANAICDFSNIDELVLTHSIESNSLVQTAEIEFKEGHHCIAYDLIRTPNLSQAALEAVPAQAVALAGFSMNQTLANHSDQVRAQIQNITGLDVGRELFANLENVVLFALPGDPSVPANPELIPTRLGLALTSRNPEQTRQVLTTVLGSISPGTGDAKNGRFRIGVKGKQDLYCYLDQINGVTLLSLSPDVIAASVAALKNHKSVSASGVLNGNINRLTPTTSKLILGNVGGLMRLIGPQLNRPALNEEQLKQLDSSFEQLAQALEAAVVDVRSDEQPDHFKLSLSATGIPPLNQVVGPIAQLKKLSEQAQAAGEAKRVRAQVPATIYPAAQAPVIDGQVEEAWNAAPVYKLERVVYDRPESADDLSASYRALWDEQNLYVLVEVTDEQLRHEHSADQFFQDDSVEIFIDATNQKSRQFGETTYQYAFCWDKTSPSIHEFKNNRVEGVQYAMTKTDKGYRVEARFPWSLLQAKPAVGSKIGLDVHVNDNDSGKRDTKIAWRDKADSAWDNPQAFGTAELGGLLGWWKFDETQGASAADSSGNGHNGTLVGNAKWARGKAGGALNLDGSESFVRIGDKSAFDIDGEITMAAWVNFRSTPAAWTTIVSKGDTAWRLSTLNTQRIFHASIGAGSSASLNGLTEVNAGEWHHVTAVYGSDFLRLYVDGRLEGNQLRTGPMKRNDFEVLIGENAEHQGRCLDGLLDDVRIYNYALPESQIRALAAGR